jgi:hypothetical protein
MAAIGYTLAAIFALAWLVITLRALFHDRARGRRRCPRCFYDIDPALGRHCTECGHTAASEAALARTRRHWRTALLAIVLLLLPALAAGMIGRWGQQGGWPAIPAPIITRLLWTGSEDVHSDVVRRIRRGEIHHADARRIVAHAAGQLQRTPEDRERALALLNALARNSFVLTADPPGTPRPMLEELNPGRLVAILIQWVEGKDPVLAASAIDLLSHLRDADERANFAILHALASPDPAITGAAQQALKQRWRQSDTVRRLPPPPSDSSPQGPITRAPNVQAAFGDRVHAFGEDRASLLAWLAGLSRDGAAAGRPEGTEGLEHVWRSLGLWLYCRLTGFDADAWSAVKKAIDDGDPLTRQTAVSQIAGFPWSTDVEEALRGVIREDTGTLQHTAISVASRFGPAANPLVPDLLHYLVFPGRGGGSSGFVKDYRAMGGDDAQLLEAMIVVLQRLVDESMPQNSPPTGSATFRTRIIMPFGDFWMESTWLADLNLRDDRAAHLLQQLMQHRPSASLALPYAVVSGDRTTATRFVLDLNPDLNQPLIVGTPQELVVTLLRRGLADLDLIEAHFVSTDDSSRRLGFAISINTFIPSHKLAPFEPMLRRLATDENSAIATPAQAALKKLNP